MSARPYLTQQTSRFSRSTICCWRWVPRRGHVAGSPRTKSSVSMSTDGRGGLDGLATVRGRQADRATTMTASHASLIPIDDTVTPTSTPLSGTPPIRRLDHDHRGGRCRARAFSIRCSADLQVRVSGSLKARTARNRKRARTACRRPRVRRVQEPWRPSGAGTPSSGRDGAPSG